MTKRATFTEAELARAWKVARKVGAVLEVSAGTIRLLPEGNAPAHDAPGDGVEECDRAFGVVSK